MNAVWPEIPGPALLSAYAHALARALIFHEGSGHQTTLLQEWALAHTGWRMGANTLEDLASYS